MVQQRLPLTWPTSDVLIAPDDYPASAPDIGEPHRVFCVWMDVGASGMSGIGDVRAELAKRPRDAEKVGIKEVDRALAALIRRLQPSALVSTPIGWLLGLPQALG